MENKSFFSSIKKKFKYNKHLKMNNIFQPKTAYFNGNSYLYNTKWGVHSGCEFNCKIIDTMVGNYVCISWNVTISPREHIHTNFTTHIFMYKNKEHYVLESVYGDEGQYLTKIGHDVWVGCHTVILHGVEIGNGAIVGAGSVVTKSVPPYAIVAGNPAKFIKWRFPRDVIQKLQELNWYEWPPDEIIRRKAELEKVVGFNMQEFNNAYFVKKKFMDQTRNNYK